MKSCAVDLVLKQLLASTWPRELPDVGAHVAGTGKGLADTALLEGEHVVAVLGSPAGKARTRWPDANDDEIVHVRHVSGAA